MTEFNTACKPRACRCTRHDTTSTPGDAANHTCVLPTIQQGKIPIGGAGGYLPYKAVVELVAAANTP